MILASPISPRYWVLLCFASVIGANAGDVLSRQLGLGYWRGLPVVGLLFASVVLAARFKPRLTVWYWIAIVLVRAAATNLSDLQILNEGEPPTVRSPLAFPIVISVWGVLLAALALRGSPQAQDRNAADTDLRFWATMLAAGTLGTAIGDWLGFRSGVDLPGASALMTVTLALSVIFLSGRARGQAVAFWVLVLVIRTWGTNTGDLLADTAGVWQSPGFTAIFATLVLLSFRYATPPKVSGSQPD